MKRMHREEKQEGQKGRHGQEENSRIKWCTEKTSSRKSRKSRRSRKPDKESCWRKRKPRRWEAGEIQDKNQGADTGARRHAGDKKGRGRPKEGVCWVKQGSRGGRRWIDA